MLRISNFYNDREGLPEVIPKSSALKIEWEKNHLRASSTDFSPILFIRDREGIQTPNPQSRNLMRYSVAPRGLLSLKVLSV